MVAKVKIIVEIIIQFSTIILAAQVKEKMIHF
jgi:hypothetical protein